MKKLKYIFKRIKLDRTFKNPSSTFVGKFSSSSINFINFLASGSAEFYKNKYCR